MMTKSVFTGLSLLVAVSILASCGPQKRAPEIKSTKIGTPGQKGVSPSSQVQADKQKIEDTKIKIPKLAANNKAIVSAITEVSSTQKANGLHIQLLSGDGDIEVLIPDDAKAKIETNALSASFKCQQEVKVIADCNNLTVTLSMPVSSATSVEAKTLVIQRNLFRDANVLRILGGKEEVHGAALVEVIAVALQPEVKTFANIEIVGTDLARVKKQISSTVVDGPVVYKVDVYGLPEYVTGTSMIYSDLVSAKDSNKVMEFQEQTTGMRLKVEYTKKFDMKDYKPSDAAVVLVGDAEMELANQTVANPNEAAIKAKAQVEAAKKTAIEQADGIAKEEQAVRDSIAADKKSINPRQRN